MLDRLAVRMITPTRRRGDPRVLPCTRRRPPARDPRGRAPCLVRGGSDRARRSDPKNLEKEFPRDEQGVTLRARPHGAPTKVESFLLRRASDLQLLGRRGVGGAPAARGRRVPPDDAGGAEPDGDGLRDLRQRRRVRRRGRADQREVRRAPRRAVHSELLRSRLPLLDLGMPDFGGSMCAAEQHTPVRRPGRRPACRRSASIAPASCTGRRRLRRPRRGPARALAVGRGRHLHPARGQSFLVISTGDLGQLHDVPADEGDVAYHCNSWFPGGDGMDTTKFPPPITKKPSTATAW
jgi:hypothetical protein